jgi:hypothetical protein
MLMLRLPCMNGTEQREYSCANGRLLLPRAAAAAASTKITCCGHKYPWLPPFLSMLHERVHVAPRATLGASCVLKLLVMPKITVSSTDAAHKLVQGRHVEFAIQPVTVEKCRGGLACRT